MCAQHGRELMGWKSPVGVPTWTHRERRITTSRRQGQAREGLSGGSPSTRGARLSPDLNSPEDCSCLAKGRASGPARPARHGQKPHSQGRGMRGELAQDSEAHRYAAYGKCGACAPTVRVLTWGDLHRQRCASRVTDPATDHTGRPRSRRCGELPAACDESAAITIDTTARRAATPGVTEQKSADAVVGSPGVGPPKG